MTPDNLEQAYQRQMQENRPARDVVPAGIKITAVDIPFWDLSLLILKATLAAIPAMILIFVISMFATLILGGLLSGIRR